MGNDYWFPWYPAVYKANTMHLTAEQDGIYRRLLDHYMDTREPLPDNDTALARIAGVNEISWLDAKRILVAYFTHSNGMFHHAFCDKQLDIQDKKARRRSASAEKAARKRWSGAKTKTVVEQALACGSHTERNAVAMRGDATETETDTIVRTPLPPKGESVAVKTFLMPDGTTENIDSLFERFWKNYPKIRDKGHKRKAKEIFNKKIKEGKNYEDIGRGITRYGRYCTETGEKNSDMFRWLRDDRWESDYTTSGNATNHRASAGRSLTNALDLAAQDKTRDVENHTQILEGLGISDD